MSRWKCEQQRALGTFGCRASQASKRASPGDTKKGFTIFYNARSEKEVDELIKGLRDKGVRIVKQPQKVFWGGYSSYIADPDGNL